MLTAWWRSVRRAVAEVLSRSLIMEAPDKESVASAEVAMERAAVPHEGAVALVVPGLPDGAFPGVPVPQNGAFPNGSSFPNSCFPGRANGDLLLIPDPDVIAAQPLVPRKRGRPKKGEERPKKPGEPEKDNLTKVCRDLVVLGLHDDPRIQALQRRAQGLLGSNKHKDKPAFAKVDAVPRTAIATFSGDGEEPSKSVTVTVRLWNVVMSRFPCDVCGRDDFETQASLSGHRRFCDGGKWRCAWCKCKSSECSGEHNPSHLIVFSRPSPPSS